MSKQGKNSYLNLRFKLLDFKNISKEKEIIDKDNYSSRIINKSKSTNELSILSYNQKESYSNMNRKNEIILLENQIKNSSRHPIFMSLMMNKKNFVNSFEKKYNIRNNHNLDAIKNNSTLIKSNSIANFPNTIKFDLFNENKISHLKNKINENIKPNKNFKFIKSKEKYKLNLSKIKEITKIKRNVNPLENENTFNNKRHSKLSEKQILKNLGQINTNIIFNTSENGNPNIKTPQNRQELLSSIQKPLQNTTYFNAVNNSKKAVKSGDDNNTSLNINDFITKDIKDKKIKRILLLSMKENKNKKNFMTKKSFKLKDIHNFQTIFLDEEKTNLEKDNKKKFINSNSYSKKLKHNINIYNKNLTTDRMISSYLSKNNNAVTNANNNTNIYSVEQPIFNSNNIKKKELDLQEKTTIEINDNKIDNNAISKKNKRNDKDKNKKQIKDKKEKSIRIAKKREKTLKKAIKKNSSKNKFLCIFNTKKIEDVYSNNKFLYYNYFDINEKTEKLSDIIKNNKIPFLKIKIHEIKNIVINERNNIKPYINNITDSLNNLKNDIYSTEKEIKSDEYYYNIKNKIDYYKISYIYFLPFKKLNLTIIFRNYVLKFTNFSSIYLPLVNRKNSQKRQALVINDKKFSTDLKESLYPDIQSKYLEESDPDKLKNFLSNINLIIRLINADIDEPKNDIDIKAIINKMNNNIKVNEIVNELNNSNTINKNNIFIKRKSLKKSADLSFMPQFTTTRNKNKITTYKKMFRTKRRGSYSYNNFNNFYKKNNFPHSLLDQKQFFDVPKRSFNIKLNTAVSNAILYNKIAYDRDMKELKKDDKHIIKLLMKDDNYFEDLINKKCIEKLKIAINKCNKIKGRKNLGDNLKLFKEIKGKKYMEETLRMLINEGEESLFLDYLEKVYSKIDINCTDENNNTFLILSVKEGLNQIVKELLEKNVRINMRNKFGNTALHYACGNKMFYTVDLLKKYGADESILNKNGLAPWECVGKSGVA